METISFKLEVFEGPLDLLLSLIAKHKLNICDIEISKLLEQYLLYIDRFNMPLFILLYKQTESRQQIIEALDFFL